uniref:Cytochrome c peroxidase, mitochondrial n=1 Tax=Rhodosorus marinus TaxID=101924 RepID=A0A7S3A3I0_9RHOD|mmetsp:Transcript_41928/g.164309  ORF Transcript_41928/g.164309 Transcript_41928/m.164309 type:complete len:193 (+) Transcript_41928:149-727(+)
MMNRSVFMLRTSYPALNAGRLGLTGSQSVRGMSTFAAQRGFTRSSRGFVQTVGVLVVGAAGVAALSGRGAPVYADTSLDYGKIKEAIEKILDDDDNMGPTLVRLAWHASGTYDVESKTGGSDGATMRFKTEAGHGANAGLGIARDKLEEVKKQFPQISYGDLWTLAGAYSIEYMGGPSVSSSHIIPLKDKNS